MKKYIVYLANKGLAGMEDIFDSGWGYCLPNAPYRLYEVLKRTQGNQNTESWNGYKRIRMQSRLDDASITASIQFLFLLSFITYRSGVKTQTTNRYSVTDFVNILVLQEIPTLEHLLRVVKRVRQASTSEKQAPKFTKPIKTMEEIIGKFSTGKIEKIPTHIREKVLSDGSVRIVRGIGGDVDFFDRYESTLKQIANFLEALYSVLRNGNNVPTIECTNNCKKDKCKCVEEINNKDSLLNFLLGKPSCDSCEGTCESQEGYSDSHEDSCEVKENNKLNNNNQNKIYNLDDEEFENTSSETERSLTDTKKKTKLISCLKEELVFFFGKGKSALDNFIREYVTNLSVSEIEESIRIVKYLKQEGYPIGKPKSYFKETLLNPSLEQAKSIVGNWKYGQAKAAQEEEKLKIEKERQAKKDAGMAASRDYYNDLTRKSRLEEIKEKLNAFVISSEEKSKLLTYLEGNNDDFYYEMIVEVLRDWDKNTRALNHNYDSLDYMFSNPSFFYQFIEKPIVLDVNEDELPY
ncbi:hypothetical protein KGF86_01760 [Ornithinibacillus massiliensis]|uniref:Uncharacterized protein n=1 Tax=Ornithinibacillus massiliensis TaxID=1944633 RepID=A0ABS5M9E8_9BACI|nr:hypothetical protein [Ornithinibacillus massiliensis]MBS3678930.1 hypothetical protein [Ornithinibacillus massiliensis]